MQRAAARAARFVLVPIACRYFGGSGGFSPGFGGGADSMAAEAPWVEDGGGACTAGGGGACTAAGGGACTGGGGGACTTGGGGACTTGGGVGWCGGGRMNDVRRRRRSTGRSSSATHRRIHDAALFKLFLRLHLTGAAGAITGAGPLCWITAGPVFGGAPGGPCGWRLRRHGALHSARRMTAELAALALAERFRAAAR